MGFLCTNLAHFQGSSITLSRKLKASQSTMQLFTIVLGEGSGRSLRTSITTCFFALGGGVLMIFIIRLFLKCEWVAAFCFYSSFFNVLLESQNFLKWVVFQVDCKEALDALGVGLSEIDLEFSLTSEIGAVDLSFLGLLLLKTDLFLDQACCFCKLKSMPTAFSVIFLGMMLTRLGACFPGQSFFKLIKLFVCLLVNRVSN